MEVIAVANNKGGCSKTTTAVNLAAYLALAGKRVLLIDLDPQGSATTHLGVTEDLENTMFEVLMENLPLSELARPTGTPGLYLCPADKRLGRAEQEISNLPVAREGVLKPKVRSQDNYNYIIIDTPPNLGFLTINAMVASDTVIVPIQCEFFAIKGLSMIMDIHKLIMENLNQPLKLRYLLTMYDARTNLSKEIVRKTREVLGDDVYLVVIPRSVKLAESPSYGKPIHLVAPESPAALSYRQLSEEVMD
jgi:chromosome partitioning protein